MDGEQVLTLVQGSCGVAVKGIEQAAEQVTEDGGPRTAGHQVEGQQGQNNTDITCRNNQLIWNRFMLQVYLLLKTQTSDD